MRRPILALLGALALLAGLLAPAQAAPGEDRGTRWYLALGDSLAAGYQPGQGDDPTGGYVGGVRDALLADGHKVRLRNLACSGETVVSMVDGGRCEYGQGNQLDAATQFLRAHRGKVELVTIDIGANDVQRCATGGSIDMACIGAGLHDVATQLPTVLGELRDAAGPGTQIVVADYYNPFLASWLTGASGQQLAQLSTVLQDMLNGVIATQAARVDADLAEVSAAFRSDDWSMTTLPGVGPVPTNVATICGWTWMCVRQDIHATDAGYAVMAETIAAALD